MDIKKEPRENRHTISVIAMGFSLASFFLILIFLISIWCSFTGFGKKFLDFFNTLNPNPFEVGYDPLSPEKFSGLSNFLGTLINCFYAFADGLIIGFCTAYLYNFYLKLFNRLASNAERNTKKTAQ